MPLLSAQNFIYGGSTAFVPPPFGPPQPIVNVNVGDSTATIQTKMNSLSGTNGSLVFPAGSSFTLTSTLFGINGVTMWASGVCTLSGQDVDFSNRTGWTIRGVGAGNGFVFNVNKINATNATHWAVGNNTFLNQPTFVNGNDGSCIRLGGSPASPGASTGLIINNDFNNCQGVLLGKYNLNTLNFDGNHFINCRQPFSILGPTDSSTTYGNNITLQRNVFSGTTRACMEFGASSVGRIAFTGLTVSNNYFTNYQYNSPNEQPPFTAMLAISLVGQASSDTTVQNNWCDAGPTDAGHGAAIEFTGTGTCSNNTILSWNFAGFTYQYGWVVRDNILWQVNTNFYANDGNPPYTGTFSNNTPVSTRPTDPGFPARIPY